MALTGIFSTEITAMQIPPLHPFAKVCIQLTSSAIPFIVSQNAASACGSVAAIIYICLSRPADVFDQEMLLYHCQINDIGHVSGLKYKRNRDNYLWCIKKNNFQVLKAALDNNNGEIIGWLISDLNKQDAIEFTTMMEDDIHWASLKNDIKTKKYLLTLLEKFAMYTLYNQYPRPFSFTMMPSGQVICNTPYDIMVPLPSDSKTVVDLYTCAMLSDKPKTGKYLAKVLKSRDKDFDINAITHDNESLLHHAARQNNCDVIKVLKQLGHNLEPKNFDARTPLDIARRYDNERSYKLLLTLLGEENYRKNHHTLMCAFIKHDPLFNEKYIVKKITSYATADDFKPERKNEKSYIGLM